MTYRQRIPEERYMLAAHRRQGCKQSEIARSLGHHRSTVSREVSMAGLSQQQCNAIARKLNRRPRKRLGFRKPLECYNESWSVLHFKVDVRCGHPLKHT